MSKRLANMMQYHQGRNKSDTQDAVVPPYIVGRTLNIASLFDGLTEIASDERSG